MTPKQYLKKCERTYNAAGGLDMLAMGAFGEAGELVDKIKKALYHGVEVNAADITNEIGDCLFYVVLWNARLHAEHPSIAGLFASWPKGRACWFGSAALRASAKKAMDAFGGYWDIGTAEKLFEALSDVAACYGMTLRQVAFANVAKLEKRYPNGFVPGGGIRE